MKRTFLATLVRSGLSAILLAYSMATHCEEDNFSKWATAHSLPLAGLDGVVSDSDLLPLESAIGSARIVALGEGLHGAHEPHAFRNRLFRFLVERMGFAAIALESGFTESIDARSFIQDGQGDAETATRNGLTSGFGRYLENRELIQWMQQYNATASAAGHRKIELYGIDLPSSARVGGARRTLNYALTFLSRADPTTAQKIRASLNTLPSTDAHEFGSLSTGAQAEFDNSINSIAAAMRKNRSTLIARSSDEAYRWAEHNLDTARQFAKCLPLTPPPGAADAKAWNAWVLTFECRDSALAKNAQWALEQEGRQGRLLIFAHNGHVMSWKEDGQRWAKASRRPSMMGLYLRQVYGNDLYVIAMSSATSAGELPPSHPIEAGSIESTLVGIGVPLFFLDIRMARQNKAALAWLTTPRSLGANIQTECLITPSTAVDAFWFVNTLTPTALSQ